MLKHWQTTGPIKTKTNANSHWTVAQSGIYNKFIIIIYTDSVIAAALY